ncbi:hypothetical protein [Microbacterium thalassium]|uniref:Integral membrane protein n=1 Tax=Microbacterium thalassium TaxID=362649 RepID=A0A7X0FP71_9MICO|nr:hypothetical protein [Microbacterium thalassium]MBB6391145.1 hypothetical protein [Microbacterium thalassium]GLK23744.1 membrane protein [Microbacterium thalassium]
MSGSDERADAGGTTSPPRSPADSEAATAEDGDRARSRAGLIGVIVTVLLIAASVIIPAATGWNVRAGHFPPLHAIWDPGIGPGTPAAILLAVLTVIYAPRAAGWSWRRLLWVVYGWGVAWMLALGLIDGWYGIGGILDEKTEYLRTARIVVADVPAFLRGFIERIPIDAEDNWAVHVAGHPPGATLFFVGLVAIGLGGAIAAGIVITLIAGTTAIAVLQTTRLLGSEQLARRAAPFLTVGPAAIWMCVSADAMFAAVAAWATFALAVAATTRRTGAMIAGSLGAGLLYGYCVMMSYGLPLLAVLALTVLWLARSWRPIPWVAVAGLAVVGVFAVFGFAWWEAFPVLRERYWAGIASDRPGAYWTWADLAAVAVSAGPWVGAGIGAAVVDGIRPTAQPRGRRAVALLALAGVAMCLLATASQMSRAEVERIWLPFVPWMLVGTALLPVRWQRAGLIVQLASALVVLHLVFTRW